MTNLLSASIIVKVHEALKKRLTKTQLREIYSAIRNVILEKRVGILGESCWEDAVIDPAMKVAFKVWDGPDMQSLQVAVKMQAMAVRDAVEDLHIKYQQQNFGDEAMPAFNQAVRSGVINAFIMAATMNTHPFSQIYKDKLLQKYAKCSMDIDNKE